MKKKSAGKVSPDSSAAATATAMEPDAATIENADPPSFGTQVLSLVGILEDSGEVEHLPLNTFQVMAVKGCPLALLWSEEDTGQKAFLAFRRDECPCTTVGNLEIIKEVGTFCVVRTSRRILTPRGLIEGFLRRNFSVPSDAQTLETKPLTQFSTVAA